MSISILEQERTRNLAGLLCIIGLLVFYGIELILGRPVTSGMLWVLLGLIAALFGLDDLNMVFGGRTAPPVQIYGPHQAQDTVPDTYPEPTADYTNDYGSGDEP